MSTVHNYSLRLPSGPYDTHHDEDMGKYYSLLWRQPGVAADPAGLHLEGGIGHRVDRAPDVGALGEDVLLQLASDVVQSGVGPHGEVAVGAVHREVAALAVDRDVLPGLDGQRRHVLHRPTGPVRTPVIMPAKSSVG